MTLVSLSVLVFLGILFLTSGAAKLSDQSRFNATVNAYRILPASLVRPVGLLLPVVEVIAAFACLAALGLASVVVVSLLAVFSTAIVWNLARGRRDIDCGCLGGFTGERLSWLLIVRNALLALIVLVPLISTGGHPFDSLWRSLDGGVFEGVEVILMATAAQVWFLLITQLTSVSSSIHRTLPA